MGGAPSASKTWSYRWKRRRRRRGNWVETIPRFGGKSGLTPVSQLSFLFSVGTKKKNLKSRRCFVCGDRSFQPLLPSSISPSRTNHRRVLFSFYHRFLRLDVTAGFCVPVNSISSRLGPSHRSYSLYIHVLYTTYRGRRSNHRDKERSTTPGLSLLSHADDEKCHRLFTSLHFFFYGTFCLYTKPCAEREKGDKGQI